MPLPLVISLLILGTLAFGLIAPMRCRGHAALAADCRAGRAPATGCIQMTVVPLPACSWRALRWHSALSMTALMALVLGSRLGLISAMLARPPVRRRAVLSGAGAEMTAPLIFFGDLRASLRLPAVLFLDSISDGLFSS